MYAPVEVHWRKGSQAPLVRVAADGNCQYAAFAGALAYLGLRNDPAWTKPSRTATLAMRKAYSFTFANHLRAASSECQWLRLAVADHLERQEHWAECEEAFAGLGLGRTREQYLADVRNTVSRGRPPAWGDHLTLAVLARLKKVNVIVAGDRGADKAVVVECGEPGRPYIALQFAGGNHYNYWGIDEMLGRDPVLRQLGPWIPPEAVPAQWLEPARSGAGAWKLFAPVGDWVTSSVQRLMGPVLSSLSLVRGAPVPPAAPACTIANPVSSSAAAPEGAA